MDKEYIVYPPNPKRYRRWGGKDWGGFKMRARTRAEAERKVIHGTKYKEGDCEVREG